MRHSDAGPSPLQWFLAEIDRLPGNVLAKQEVRRILRRMVGQRMHLSRRDLVHPEMHRIARDLMAAGHSPKQTRKNLAVRSKCSHQTAGRIVTRALNARAEDASNDAD